MRSLDPGIRLAGRAQQMRAVAVGIVVLGGQLGDGAGRLGHAVDLDEIALEHLHGRQQRLVGDRRGAVDDRAQRGKRALGRARHLRHEAQHGRHEQRVGDRFLLISSRIGRGIELADDDGDAAAVMPTSAQPQPPMWNSGMHTRLTELSSKRHGAVTSLEQREQVGVGHHDALGQAGGAAGVELQADVVGATGTLPVDRPAARRPTPRRPASADAAPMATILVDGRELRSRSARRRPKKSGPTMSTRRRRR